MKIESYFRRIQKIVNSSPAVQLTNITYDKRSTYEGFIRGELTLSDGSALHFREFIDVEIAPDRLMYTYHYVDASNSLIFRYDNTGHHKKLGLSSYPNHKHEGETRIIASQAPDLAAVLQEIELLIRLD